MSYFTWKKGEKIKLSQNFASSEGFDCTCHYEDCIEQKISKTLIEKLQTVRNKLGAPITVNNGFRCAKKQADLRQSGIKTAVGQSTHELGHAVDIKSGNMPGLLSELEKEFDSIGIANTFFHADLRPGKRRWKY